MHLRYLLKSSNSSFIEFALPPSKSDSGMFEEDSQYDSCSMFQNLDSSTCHPDLFDNATTILCQSYVYETSLFPETLTTEFNLVRYIACEKVLFMIRYVSL